MSTHPSQPTVASPSKSKATLTPAPFALVVLVALLSLLLQGMDSVANDPGIGWHLATGEFIATHQQVPQYDPFLSVSRRWVCDQWLSDLLLYKLYTLGGWPLLYGVVTSIYLLTYLGLLRTSARVAVGAPLSATIACLLAFRTSAVHFIARPVLFSFHSSPSHSCSCAAYESRTHPPTVPCHTPWRAAPSCLPSSCGHRSTLHLSSGYSCLHSSPVQRSWMVCWQPS